MDFLILKGLLTYVSKHLLHVKDILRNSFHITTFLKVLASLGSETHTKLIGLEFTTRLPVLF